MSTWKRGQQLASTFSMIIEGLETISKLTATTVDDKAVAVLQSIAKAIDVLKAGVDGHMSIEACEGALAELRSHLHATDAVADAQLHERFPTG